MRALVPSRTSKATPIQALRQAAALPRAWHLLSLDAPTVAATWCAAFLRAGGIWSRGRASWAPVLFLSLATWICYVGDRVLDARSAPAASLRARHRFYGKLWRKRPRSLLAVLVVVALACAAIALRALSTVVLLEYAALTALSLFYFGWVHVGAQRAARLLPKELAVAAIFAIGCALPAWSAAEPSRRGALLPAGMLFGALCWLNCVAIERWEGQGALGPQTHPSTRFAAAHLTALSGLGSFAGIALSASPPAASGRVLGPCLAAAFMLLALLERFRLRLATSTLRVLADVALLTPLVWWLMAGAVR